MAARRKHKLLKKWPVPLVLLIVVAVYIIWIGLQPFVSVSPKIMFQPQTNSAQKVSLSWPGYGQAAIGATGYGVLATNGSQTPVATASIAKLVTALAVIRQRPLQPGDDGPTITITQADIDSYNKYVGQNGSVVKVTLGEQITERQALEALLLPSANNVAETLARWTFGSIDAYNQYANNYAQELGLTSIKITDPSGFLPTTVASAHDLTILGEQAMLNPALAKIVAEPSANIPIQGTIYNVNFLIGSDYNVGIKTGNNDQDPGAYLFAFSEPIGDGSVLIVGTILGGPDLSVVLKDAKTLANSAASHFKQVSFIKTGDVVATYAAPHGQTVQAVAADNVSLMVWDGSSFSSSISVQNLHDSTSAGSRVGTVHVINQSTHATNSVDIVLKQSLQLPDLRSRLSHPF